MLRFRLAVAALACLLIAAENHADDSQYQLGPDSHRHEGVPRGTVTKHIWKSRIFDGTVREYWIYVPAQYDGSPAAVMVFQDGHTYVDEEGQSRVPVVFDNLIHQGVMPVTIGVFINPGHHGDEPPQNRWRASNRSFEYDSLSELYARFLLEEILPEVGKEYKLKDEAASRAICGISSGGICAFTVAWQRPDAFHKVLSHVGSFTNIRGGHEYPAWIRKWSQRPIRAFLQDGENDLNNTHGNWWLANRQMASALAFRNYDFKFVGGVGGHNGIHGGAILPDALRWLWREGDTPVEERSITYSGGVYENETFRYRLLRPDIVEPGQKYPLVLFLHGAGERGDDNSLQLKYFPEVIGSAEQRRKHACFVLAPQCRKDHKWVDVDWGETES
ncbi:MAG: hypothetical protein KY476_23840, partial [Planctomycetes bacterium]|nr:hypothetical protein [Planctomycetota bacterium]